MLVVVIDANVIVSDPLLKSATWEAIEDAQNAGRLRIMTPRLAVDEAIAAYARKRQTTSLEIKKISRRASRAVQAILLTAMEQASSEADRYPKLLKGALKQRGVELLRTPQVDHQTVAKRAIARSRPFDDNGDGYRDTLHWYSFLSVVDDLYDGHDLVFVSNDGRAYGGPDEEDGEAGLHPDLKRDLESFDARYPWIRWFRDLSDVPVPGQFMDEVDARALALIDKSEVAAHVLDQLRMERLDLDPSLLGLDGDIADVMILSLEDAVLREFSVQQYYENADFRITFTAQVDAELATQTVVHGATGDFIEEGRLETPLLVSGALETPGYGAPLGPLIYPTFQQGFAL
jgi:hypothetical protein